jgi:hypothetical protein
VLVLAAEGVGGALTRSGLTGHQNGLIGQTTRILVWPSQPASRRSWAPRERGAGSKVQAVSVPPVVRMPRSPSTSREGSLRQSTSEPLRSAATKSERAGVIAPASAP